MSSSEEESSIQVFKERSFRSTPPVYAPSFCILHRKKEQNQTFCIPFDHSYHVRSVPELSGMYCLGSSYGWLILQSNYSDECHLFNPVTLDKIQLPPLPYEEISIGVLTYPPTDSKSVIMFFSEEKSSCIFCRIGDGKWIEQAVRGPRRSEEDYSDMSAVSREGKAYLFLEGLIGIERELHIIDVRDNLACMEVHKIKYPQRLVPACMSSNFYYVESCGEFFQVIMIGLRCGVILNLLVFRLEWSEMTWEKVENLGNRIFLLGDHADSVSLPSSEFGAKGNCIYFFINGRTELYVFDMNSGMITITQHCPTKFHQCGQPFWVVPSCNGQVKKEVAEVTEEIQVTSSNLLPELLEMIFRFLHLGGLQRFRFSSKVFISMNLPVQPFHPQALSSSQHLPWLISFPHTKGDICHFYHPIYTNSYTVNIPQLRGAIVQHAKFGWLLMSVGRSSLFFFNPFTTEIIKLPDKPRGVGYGYISFSAPPTSSDYVIFVFQAVWDTSIWFYTYHKVQDHWSEHILRDQPHTFVPSLCNPVFCSGVFYSLSKDGKLGIFNPNATNDEDMWRVEPNLSVPDVRVTDLLMIVKDTTRSFIMECDGDIYSVFVGFVGSLVRVYKLDQSKKKIKWLKVETLGDRVMFLSRTMSLLLPAVLKGTENRIYLPRFKGNSRVFYSLLSGKYHSFREQEPRSDWIDTSEYWHCTWRQNFESAPHLPPYPNMV